MNRKLIAGLLLSALAASVQAQETESRIFTLSECPATTRSAPPPVASGDSPGVAALFSAAISPLVDAVVDQAAKVLTDAAADKDFPLRPPATIYPEFYQLGSSGDVRINPAIYCVVVVRGRFIHDLMPEAATPSPGLPGRVEARMRVADPGAKTDRPTAKTRLDGPPDFYFEAAVIPSVEDRKLFALRPQAFYVREFASKDGLFGSDQRSYKVAITFQDMSGKDAFASTTFEFKGVERDQAIVACLDQLKSEGCDAETLGGLHGWFATRPATDGTADLAKGRASIASMLARAVDRPPPPAQEIAADDKDGTLAAARNYCAELSRDGLHDSDICPVAVGQLKRVYVAARAKDQAAIDQDAADTFWNANCGSPTEVQRTKTVLTQCLSKMSPAILSGQFGISATIVETRPGNKVAKFFAPAVAAVTPVLKQTIKAQVDPVERAKAEADKTAKSDAAKLASLQSRRTAATSLLAARKAQLDYDTALAKADSPNNGDVITAQIALLQAEAAANDAARAAALAIPFPDVDS